MSRFTVLDAADSVQYNQWISIWEAWEAREVFAHPEYLKSLKRECDSALCVVQEDVGGVVLLPVILRPLCSETWAGMGNKYQDIVTPYGFGGPFGIGTPNLADFWKGLAQWAACNRIISAFFRFSPFSADIKSMVSQVEVRNGNVIRSLPEGNDLIWQEYDKTVRHHIRRADSLGLKVEVDTNGKRMNDFLRIYYETMRRRNALPYYYFPERLFNNIFQTIPGSAILFHVTNGNTVISSEMVLVAEENMYAFLGGTDGRFTDMNSGELLSHSIINWGIENGKKQYVMGGGYKGHDGIFQFKKKFAPNGTVPFEVGKHIFDSTAYINMCEKRREYDRQQGQDRAEDSSYFPAYRTQYD